MLLVKNTKPKRFVYTFQCPVCAKHFRYDEPGEPLCTGPSEMREDHPLEVMRLIRVDREEVNPVKAEERAVGELLMPWHEPEKLIKDALIVISK